MRGIKKCAEWASDAWVRVGMYVMRTSEKLRSTGRESEAGEFVRCGRRAVVEASAGNGSARGGVRARSRT